MNLQERIEADGYGDAEPVLFYYPQNANGVGSNFSPHPVVMLNPWTGSRQSYATGEYRYQALKARFANAHDYVLKAADSNEAKNRGREIALRAGWGNSYGDLCWYVMAELILAKTLQHDVVMRWLVGTEGRPIYEDSPTDDIWGVRYQSDYSGKNLLGRSWMYARGILLS